MGHCRLLKIILWDGMTLLSNWRICLQGKDDHGESAWSSSLKGLMVSYKKLKNNYRTSDGFLYLTLTYLSDLDLSLMETRKMIVYKTKSINNQNNRLLSFLAAQGSNEIHVVPSCATTDGAFCVLCICEHSARWLLSFHSSFQSQSKVQGTLSFLVPSDGPTFVLSVSPT